MSYPQLAQASAETLEGQDYFRLFTEIQSSGDIYEMDTSAQAFVIGPQSDIARARVTYFDPSNPAQASSFVVSVDSPFIGRVDSIASTKYPNGTSAKILITPEDIINNSFVPSGIGQADIRALVKPKLDLLGYLAPPFSFPPKRADFTKSGICVINDDGGHVSGTSYLTLPYYRRRFASLKFLNLTAGQITVSAIGYVWLPALASRYIDTQLLAASNIAAGADGSFNIKASTVGLHDAILIKVFGVISDGTNPAACVYYDVVLTDEEN